MENGSYLNLSTSITEMKAENRYLGIRLDKLDDSLEKLNDSLKETDCTLAKVGKAIEGLTIEICSIKKFNDSINGKIEYLSNMLDMSNQVIQRFEPVAEYAANLKIISKMLLFIIGIAIFAISPDLFKYIRMVMGL